jgi:hypothetical protein
MIGNKIIRIQRSGAMVNSQGGLDGSPPEVFYFAFSSKHGRYCGTWGCFSYKTGCVASQRMRKRMDHRIVNC